MNDQWPTPEDCRAAVAVLNEPPITYGGSVTPVREDVARLTLAVAELQRQVEELQGDVYRLRNGWK